MGYAQPWIIDQNHPFAAKGNTSEILITVHKLILGFTWWESDKKRLEKPGHCQLPGLAAVGEGHTSKALPGKCAEETGSDSSSW